jgi:hypothetical protein
MSFQWPLKLCWTLLECAAVPVPADGLCRTWNASRSVYWDPLSPTLIQEPAGLAIAGVQDAFFRIHWNTSHYEVTLPDTSRVAPWDAPLTLPPPSKVQPIVYQEGTEVHFSAWPPSAQWTWDTHRTLLLSLPVFAPTSRPIVDLVFVSEGKRPWKICASNQTWTHVQGAVYRVHSRFELNNVVWDGFDTVRLQVHRGNRPHLQLGVQTAEETLFDPDCLQSTVLSTTEQTVQTYATDKIAIAGLAVYFSTPLVVALVYLGFLKWKMLDDPRPLRHLASSSEMTLHTF